MSSSTRPPSPAPPNSAPERRCDLVTGQWVVIAGGRQQRPHDFLVPRESPGVDSCAFCAGREYETTPTVARYPLAASPESGGWQVRVVSNLYPAFVPSPAVFHEGAAAPRPTGAGGEPSWGRHEVIIESASHRRQLTELTRSEVEMVFAAYRDRFRSARDDEHYRYALIFKNSGRDAGMSREHLHSQLVALPEVPLIARQEQLGALKYYRTHGGCVFCHLIDETMQDRSRLVLETETVVAFCPYASRVAHELWVLPKRHGARFEQTDDAVLNDVAVSVRELVRRLGTCLGPVAYNYLLHSNPFDTCRQDHYHWHIEILPRTSRLAGLEWGTGLLINTMPPEVAAAQLRGVVKV
jgi:UDPglucose--hexose-1-phosphate uridylyltransferase